MLETASRLLVEHQLISEAIKVPDDLWGLTDKVTETLQDLARWCRKTGHRWIWVLDGLDRLAPDDQKALPWLPVSLPVGVHVLTSALDCSARSILQEHDYTVLTIEPLQELHQQQPKS